MPRSADADPPMDNGRGHPQASMCHAEYRARGLPIGSGTTASGCKQIVTARLKQAGMIWSPAGAGIVPGYRTLDAIGVGPRRRGLLYHRPFGRAAAGFPGEWAETQEALAASGAAPARPATEVTDNFDRGFDDIAV